MTYIDLDEVDFEKLVEAVKAAISRNIFSEESIKRMLSESITIPIEELKLEELASLGFSITDPIGQIAEWLASQLKNLASWFATAVETIIAPIKSMLDSVWSFVQRIPSYVIDGLRVFFTQLSNAVSSILDNLRKIAGEIGSAVSSIGSTILKNLGDVFSALKNALSSLGDTILKALSGVLSTLQGALSKAVESILAFLKSVGDALASAVKGIIDTIVSIAGKIGEMITALGEAVKKGLESFINMILDGLKKAWDFIQNIGQMLGDAIAKGIQFLSDALSKAGEAIMSMLRQAGSMILEAIGKIPEFFTAVKDAVVSMFQSLANWIWEGIKTVGETIYGFFEKVWKGIVEIGEKIFTILSEVASKITEGIKYGLDSLWNNLQKIAEGILDSLGIVRNTIISTFQSLINSLWEGVKTIGDNIYNLFKEVWTGLTTLGDKIISTISEGISTIFENIKSSIDFLWNTIREASRGILEALDRVWSFIGEWMSKISGMLQEFSSRLKESLENVFNTLMNTISSNVDQIMRTLSTLPDAFYNMITNIFDVLGKLHEEIILIGEKFKTAATQLLQTLEVHGKYLVYAAERGYDLIEFLTGFYEGLTGEKAPPILPPKAMFTDGSPGQGPAYRMGVAGGSSISWLLTGQSAMTDVFKTIQSAILDFLKNPAEWFTKNLVTPMWNTLLNVAETIMRAVGDLGKIIYRALSTIKDVMINLFKSFGLWLRDIILSLVSWLIDRAKELYEGAKTIGWTITRTMIDTILKIQEWSSDAVKSALGPLVNRLFKELGISTPPYLTPWNFLAAWILSHAVIIAFYLIPLLSSFEMRAAAYVIRGMGMTITRIPMETYISLAPLGLGVSVRLDLSKCLGPAIMQFGDELEKFGDEYFKGLWRGYGHWFGRYVSVWWNFYFRNLIPIEFPPLTDISEAWLRSRVAEKIPSVLGAKTIDIQEGMLYYLKLRGYSDFVIKYWYAEPEEFYTTLFDRFQIERKIPLAGVWKLPSPSDVARMWIRDVLRPPTIAPEKLVENLTKIYEAVGIYRDVGLLYTLLAFRYPSPGDLAEFYWRGIAKLLWLPTSMEEPEWRTIFRIPDTWKSIAPYELNLRADRAKILNTLISIYMRWHDYFPVAWHPDFPTDKAIVTELMAELPGRLDLRWLTRWGIFQHLSEAGVDVMADLKTIYESFTKLTGEETRKREVSPEIILDARFLARFLIGARVNPLIAPLLSVAQVHAVLAPELTLLRTGFIDSVRRGYITLDVSEELMSGLIKIMFRTGYIDYTTGEFKEVVYPKPVFWLPAERRLLQMRAVFDRYNMLLTDLVRRAVYGIVWVAITPDEAIAAVRDLHSILSQHISKCIKKISGIDWKPILDEEYIQVWIKYATGVRTIGVRTWIRRHISRFMGWLFFRIIYGWVEPETLDRFIENISKVVVNGKEIKVLADEEVVFFKTVAQQIYGIVKRELVPSPSTLATLSEYLDISREIVDRALEQYKIPSPFDEIYRAYINVRPIKSDYKTLLNRARTAYVKKIITDEEWKRYLERAVNYGFTRRELEIIQEIADLEEKIQESRSWSPTILTLITISEIIPRAIELLKEYPVKPAFREIINEYAKKKPLVDDLRALITAYFRAKRYTEIPKELEDRVQEYFRELGVTEAEIAIRNLAIELLEIAEEARQWTPTPSTIATISEYVEIPQTLIDQALAKKKISEEWAKILRQYITIRPLADDLRALISAYFRAKRYIILPKEIEDQVQSYLSRYGFTKEELEIRNLAIELLELVDEAKAWVPSISTIATISEYIEIPQELIDQALARKKVPEAWSKILKQYIAIRPLIDEIRALISAYYRAKRYVEIPKEIDDRVQAYFKEYGLTPEEQEVRNLIVQLLELVEEARAWTPSPTAIATISEYVEIPQNLIDGVLAKKKISEEWAKVLKQYIQVRPLADEIRELVRAYYRAKRYAVLLGEEIPKEIEDKIKVYFSKYGVTPVEMEVRDTVISLEVLAEEFREALRTRVPSPTQIASLSEYIYISPELVEVALEKYRVDERFKPIFLNYIKIRPIIDDARGAINAYYRAVRYSEVYGTTIPKEIDDSIKSLMQTINMTEEEKRIRELRARIEAMIDIWRQEVREYLPTPTVIATISEYITLPSDLISKTLEKRRVPKEWIDIWIKYIQVRPLADDARALMTAYYRAVRASRFYGVTIPQELTVRVQQYLSKAGVTQEEIEIRDLAAEFEVFVEELRRGETIPALGALVTMSEYIEIPSDYILSILTKRRIEATYRELWLKYIEARSIATEVNRVVSAFTTLYTRFAVPTELVDAVRQLMSRGGWTSKEIEIFDVELYIRKLYRTLTLVIPTVRQFIIDATYLPRYESLLEDLFNTYAISIKELQKQVEYYKKLIKNRRIWRHFSWYRTQLTYAYTYGAISEEEARKALMKFVDIGLIDEDELNIIIEGMKIRALGYRAYRATR